MIGAFIGSYPYSYTVIRNWNSNEIGVYYCGVLAPQGELLVHYVGSAVGEDGIRGRLLQHRNESKWSDVTHFGYHPCSNSREAIELEKREIARLNPKYNKQGVFRIPDLKTAAMFGRFLQN